MYLLLICTVKIKNRWLKKRSGIETLANSIQRLRYNITKDLQSDDEKVYLTALGLDIMIATGERVGNGDSAGNGHYGVTYFKTISTFSSTVFNEIISLIIVLTLIEYSLSTSQRVLAFLQ